VLRTSHPVTLRARPHFSVSQSESGFEKIMQATTLLLEWPVTAPQLIVTLEIKAHAR
jgi:4-alpha-glucanotransferase/alpha-amylase